MPDTYEGTAKEAFEQLTETRNRVLLISIWKLRKKQSFLLRNQKDIVASRNAIAQLSGNFDVRKACSMYHGDKHAFLYLMWMDDRRKMPELFRRTLLSKMTAAFSV